MVLLGRLDQRVVLATQEFQVKMERKEPKEEQVTKVLQECRESLD